MKSNLISPTREKNYTWSEILKKGLDRAKLSAKKFRITELHCCFYGSRDYAMEVEKMECSDSLWNESVSFEINGIIPIHATADGGLCIGWRCGCDKRHGGQFPQQADPDNQNWDAYKKTDLGLIVAYVGEADSPDKTDTIGIAEIIDANSEEEEYQVEPEKVLLWIVKEIVARATFLCADPERIIGAEKI